MPAPKLYTPDEAAKYLSIGKYALESLAQNGLIVRQKSGGRWRYLESELDAYQERQHLEGMEKAESVRYFLNGGTRKYRSKLHKCKSVTNEEVIERLKRA